MDYLLDQATTRKTPQSEPIPGREREMTRNNAGGFAFTADSFARLERFLILGSEGGSYYVGERDLTKENLDNVRACIQQDGSRAVRAIVEISVAGRAPKNDPALYALALAASYGADADVRATALDALPKVARTGTHLFTFAAYIDSMRGWGPALRKAIARWYEAKSFGEKLGYQLAKYQQRNGWSHRDLFRLAHVPHKNLTVCRWVIGADMGERTIRANEKRNQKERVYPAASGELPELIRAMESAKKVETAEGIALMIRTYGLTREMIPTEHQKSPVVWEALLERMLPGAMIRTLGRMGAAGLLTPLSETENFVCTRLVDPLALRAARVHPIAVLAALLTYGAGKGQKGKLTWPVSPRVMDALNAAFYRCFENVEPTGKRFYLGVDVSGSMTSGTVAGMDGLTPNMGAAAMAMLIARTEEKYFIGGFSHRFIDLGISKSDSLTTAIVKCQRDFGGTDCVVAINHSLANRIPVDAFVIITDGETWAGETHVSQAIQHYRRETGIDAKLIVMNMVANRTALVDPADAGSLDIVGFDASVPAIIGGFLGARRETAVVEEE